MVSRVAEPAPFTIISPSIKLPLLQYLFVERMGAVLKGLEDDEVDRAGSSPSPVVALPSKSINSSRKQSKIRLWLVILDVIQSFLELGARSSNRSIEVASLA